MDILEREANSQEEIVKHQNNRDQSMEAQDFRQIFLGASRPPPKANSQEQIVKHQTSVINRNSFEVWPGCGDGRLAIPWFQFASLNKISSLRDCSYI